MSKVFTHWRERLEAAGGVVPTRIRVTRKSSREEERQKFSHEQQMSEMDAAWGAIDENWWWKESLSGTSFDRPYFQDVLDFCRSNPRTGGMERGRVEWWAPHRFGRSLDADGQPAVLTFMSMYDQFEQAGWELHFLKVPRTGNQLGDVINIAVHAYAAAVYSKDLSENASRGRRNEGGKGWWVNGQAPWGTLRKDTLEGGRVLKKGEKSKPGGGGTILVADPDVLSHWKEAAELFLAGASYKGIGEDLYEDGLRGPQGGALGHKHMKNFLTNQHLIGKVLIRNAAGEAEWHPAKWDALVDRTLFERVQEEVARREAEPRNMKRTSKGTFLLRPACAHCGIEYHGGRNGKKNGNERTYVHPTPHKVNHAEIYEAYVEHGCRAWTVMAGELEDEIKDLILRERTSAGYEEEVRSLILEKEEFEQRTVAAVASAEAKVEELEALHRRQARRLARMQDSDIEEDELFDELQATQQKLNVARAEVQKAEEFRRSRKVAWDRLSEVINETRNLAVTWDKVGLEARRRLLEWWVLDVQIVVRPVPGKKKKAEKLAMVTLRSDPNAPRYFGLGDALASADSSSSRTKSSSSDSTAADSTSAASDEPTLPSAQAACARTNGSGSDSARVSTGTASGDPQLPSPTQTLRANPERPARRTAEPRENDSQDASSRAMASRSTSEGEEVPGCHTSESSRSTPNGGSPGARAANEGSEVGRENFRGNGHTSCLMCRLSIIRIPLRTGRGTSRMTIT